MKHFANRSCNYNCWECLSRNIRPQSPFLQTYSEVLSVYTRLQKRWHATSVYNERWDSAKSYPNFPGRKRFIMRKDFPWIMREVNHWLCICASISHKGDGSCRSWIKLLGVNVFAIECRLSHSYHRYSTGRENMETKTRRKANQSSCTALVVPMINKQQEITYLSNFTAELNF